MSEVIVRMEMPKNCHECEAKCVSALYGRICGMTRKNIMPFLDKPNRPDWCPIKGVLPDEHGDLIDRDELLKRKGNCYDSDGHLLYAVGTGSILQMKAIIKAERKADADYQLSVLMQEYFERYEPTYNSEDGSM